jgi:hypothetical protein
MCLLQSSPGASVPASEAITELSQSMLTVFWACATGLSWSPTAQVQRCGWSMNDGLAELEEHRQPEHTGFCFFHVSDQCTIHTFATPGRTASLLMVGAWGLHRAVESCRGARRREFAGPQMTQHLKAHHP